MTVYIEVFLIDNFLMNMIILLLSGALCAIRMRVLRMSIASFIGALYALAMLVVEDLNGLILKLALSILMTGIAFLPKHFFSMGFKNCLRSFGKYFLSFYVSTLLTGGAAWAILLASGEDYSNGLVMTIPLRVALIAAVVASFLPRIARSWIISKKGGAKIKLRVELDQIRELNALIDSGNSLVEPISGLPVVIAYSKAIGSVKNQNGRPVPYSDISGNGILLAYRPRRIEAYTDGSWKEIDAYIGLSQTPLKMGVEALIGTSALNLL